jgi:hypothetical protein
MTTIEGIYERYDPRKKRSHPPKLTGHAGITLDDGRWVYLEPPWSEEAIRPKSEAAFDGKRVIVTAGELSEHMPSPPNPGSHQIGWVLLGIVDVKLAP